MSEREREKKKRWTVGSNSHKEHFSEHHEDVVMLDDVSCLEYHSCLIQIYET